MLSKCFLPCVKEKRGRQIGWSLLEEGSECHLKVFRLALQEAMSHGIPEQCRDDQSWDGRRRTSKCPCSGTPGAITENVGIILSLSHPKLSLNSKQPVLSKEDLITSNMMRNGILSLPEAQKTDFGGDIFKIKNGH